MRSSFLIGGLALAAAVILGFTFYYRTSDQSASESPPPAVMEPAESSALPEPETSRPVMEETPPSPVISAPELVLPVLDASDGFVRERLPEAVPEVWIDKDDLIRRLAVLLENAARGELPRRQLAFLAPEGPFLVREESADSPDEVRIFIDPAGYARYDRYLDVLEAFPPASLASLLSDTDPLIQQALQELGVSESAEPEMLVAIDQVLAVPVLEGDVELVQPKVFYEYADPELESLSSLQKQVLRMGPENVARLKTYLQALRGELERR